MDVAVRWRTVTHSCQYIRLSTAEEKVTFTEPHMWLLNSPDLNPADYAICSALKQKVYLRCQSENADQLKLALEAERNRLSHTFINRNINEWRQRLKAVVKNNGGHIKHLLNNLNVFTVHKFSKYINV